MTDRSVEHATIVIERHYDAPPAAVFAAWAEPAVRQRWFVAAEGWEIAEYSHDFRVGGRERGRFAQKTAGPVYGNDTLYWDIVPGRRIIFAYTMARDGTLISASLATVELRPDGPGTLLVFTEQGAFLDGGDQPRFREHGWNDLLDRLGAEIGPAAA